MIETHGSDLGAFMLMEIRHWRKHMVEILSLEWEHEDQLPELTDVEYDLLCEYSKVIDGVRMFPYTKYWDHMNNEEVKAYLGA